MSARLDGGHTQLRLGRYQDVLADVRADTVIVDAPYSDVTHRGHDSGRRNDGSGLVDAQGREATRAIDYPAWTPLDVREFVGFWAPRTNGWIVSITDHVLAPDWCEALKAQGRYVFAPLPLVEVGGRVRLTGDGPSSWTCWIVVARPKSQEFARWGTLPGAYIQNGRTDKAMMGGKPLPIMRALVRDYSRPGDLVVDPCAGAATTLLAAALEGRNGLGSEASPDAHRKGAWVLATGHRGYEAPTGNDGSAWLEPWGIRGS